MNWHKNLVEKSLKSLGMSSYQGMWSAFIKGVVITCILFYFIDYNKNSDDNKIKFEIEYSEKFQEDGFDGLMQASAESLWITLYLGVLPTGLFSMVYFRKKLGGITGDCMGSTQQLTEVVFYIFMGFNIGL